MSRIRKATVTAGFGYAQFAFAIVTGLVLVPITLHYLGTRTWGLWLASGEVLGYAAMIDLGVLGVLPWMIGEADGRRDRQAIRTLVTTGMFVGVLAGVGYALVGFGLWSVLPYALGLTPDDRALIGPPLTLLIAAHAISYPLRVFRAVLAGMQDALFNGVLTLVQSLLTVTLTAVLLISGYGLFALAAAASLPSVIVLVAATVRVVMVTPDVMSGWKLPRVPDVRNLLVNGAGVWLSAVGWQLLAASNAIVMTGLGHPEWVAIYSCTAKLSTLGAQLAWVLPDSGLVGLAQVAGEAQSEPRLRGVVLMMLRLHLLLAGAGALALLALNPTFVSIWVGPALFGGLGLNALLAAGIVLYSLVHGLITTASVLGNRVQVGVVTLINGVVQIGLAVLLGTWWGLTGIAAAGLLAGIATAVPACIALLMPRTALTPAGLAGALVQPWLARTLPLAGVAAAIGIFRGRLGIVASAVLGSLVLALYVWYMRPFFEGLPVPVRVRNLLVRIRLVPEMAPAHGAIALGVERP
jgi:O-antigen/teichoic acid export membrane protein